jgi:hypothetical protein
VDFFAFARIISRAKRHGFTFGVFETPAGKMRKRAARDSVKTLMNSR